jgi:hypothetical protein
MQLFTVMAMLTLVLQPVKQFFLLHLLHQITHIHQLYTFYSHMLVHSLTVIIVNM